MDGFIAAVGHTIVVGSSKVRFLVSTEREGGGGGRKSTEREGGGGGRKREQERLIEKGGRKNV